MKYAGLADVLKHPLTIGTSLGGLGGAGVGYASADSDDPNRLRKTLVGGATGAAIGALGGGLAGRSSARTAREAAQAIDDAFEVGSARGFAEAYEKMKTDYNMAKKVMDNMPEEMRDRLVKQFRKGWLTRALGG